MGPAAVISPFTYAFSALFREGVLNQNLYRTNLEVILKTKIQK